PFSPSSPPGDYGRNSSRVPPSLGTKHRRRCSSRPSSWSSTGHELHHIGDEMIEQVVEKWHRFIRDDLSEGLDNLLADDVVFYSPIVYTPQRGKAVTTMYLHAAAQTLLGDGGDGGDGAFRYAK